MKTLVLLITSNVCPFHQYFGVSPMSGNCARGLTCFQGTDAFHLKYYLFLMLQFVSICVIYFRLKHHVTA